MLTICGIKDTHSCNMEGVGSHSASNLITLIKEEKGSPSYWKLSVPPGGFSIATSKSSFAGRNCGPLRGVRNRSDSLVRVQVEIRYRIEPESSKVFAGPAGRSPIKFSSESTSVTETFMPLGRSVMSGLILACNSVVSFSCRQGLLYGLQMIPESVRRHTLDLRGATTRKPLVQVVTVK